MQKLHVIAVISNPIRYASRLRLANEFIERMLAEPDVDLTVVEHAFGERPFEITDQPSIRLVQVRGNEHSELWIKESLIRKGVQALPHSAKYIAWIDADIQFLRPDWAAETVHALQHYAVVQPWSHSIDLGPQQQIIANETGQEVDKSYCAAWEDGDLDETDSAEGYTRKNVRSHYGFAWAMRTDVYDRIGGPIDWLVTGAADYHIALAFAGRLWYDDRMTPGYQRRLRTFQQRCDEHVRTNIGCVRGTIAHGWHGPKKQRSYLGRFQIITDSKFDPDHDLTMDWQGIPVLTGTNTVLRDGLRRYLRARNEDSVDTE